MPVINSGKQAGKQPGDPDAPATAPITVVDPPEPPKPVAVKKIPLVLKLYKRYDFERFLYTENVVYNVSIERARKLLAQVDEMQRPIFARYVPKVEERVVIKGPVIKDLEDPKVRAEGAKIEPRDQSKQRLDVGDDSELGDLLEEAGAAASEGVTLGD